MPAAGQTRCQRQGKKKGKKKGTLYFFEEENGDIVLFWAEDSRVQPFKVTRDQVETLNNESVLPKEWNADTETRRFRGSFSTASLRRYDSASISKGRMSHRPRSKLSASSATGESGTHEVRGLASLRDAGKT